MRYIFDNDLHIHSKISLCSRNENQTPERILKYAIENNLKTICLTDHFWDETVEGASGWYAKQNYEHISRAKPLPQSDGVRFLFGCETEIDKNMTVGLSKEHFDRFDFVVIPTTHFHMTGFTIDEAVFAPFEKSRFWLKKLNALLDRDLPFEKIGLAHLTCGLIDNDRARYLEVIESLSDSELAAVFERVAKCGAGVELNKSDMEFAPSEMEIVLRPYRIAKACGCKFYMGSDAHCTAELDSAKATFEKTIDLLELTEDDKFRL